MSLRQLLGPLVPLAEASPYSLSCFDLRSFKLPSGNVPSASAQSAATVKFKVEQDCTLLLRIAAVIRYSHAVIIVGLLLGSASTRGRTSVYWDSDRRPNVIGIALGAFADAGARQWRQGLLLRPVRRPHMKDDGINLGTDSASMGGSMGGKPLRRPT